MGAKELEKAEHQGLHNFFRLSSKLNTSNMICFDFEGKIKKYNSLEEILEDFQCAWRSIRNARSVVDPPFDDSCFDLYMQDYLANELQMTFEKLTNQAWFVKMIVNKELVISNRKNIDIVADLRKLKFRPFSKTSTNTGGEIEDNEEEETQTDFDYLLGMAISSLTKKWCVWDDLLENNQFLRRLIIDWAPKCTS